MHRIPGASGDCGRSWRVDGASTGATAAAQAHAHNRVQQTFERAPNLSLGSSQLAPIIKWVLVLHCKEDFFLVML